MWSFITSCRQMFIFPMQFVQPSITQHFSLQVSNSILCSHRATSFPKLVSRDRAMTPFALMTNFCLEVSSVFKWHFFQHVSCVQNLCWLMIVADYTIQYNGDSNNPIEGSLWTKQYNGMKEGFWTQLTFLLTIRLLRKNGHRNICESYDSFAKRLTVTILWWDIMGPSQHDFWSTGYVCPD